jgi:recombination protein RecT
MTIEVSNGGAAVQKRDGEMTLRDFLNSDRMRASIKAVLPRHLTAERIIKVALAATMRTPKLLECTRASLIQAIMQAAELGLEPGSALGHAYLVPFNRKTNAGWIVECVMIPGYRGLIALARRSGEIVSIEVHPVYEKDAFKLQFGLNPILEHTPTLTDEPGNLIAVYGVAKLRDGGTQIEVMTRAQILSIRSRSQTGRKNEGPWSTDFDEMARKTVVRRMFKYLPVSIEVANAMEHLDEIEGEVIDPSLLAESSAESEQGGPAATGELPEPTRTESLKAKLGAVAAAAPVPEPVAVPVPVASAEREPGADDYAMPTIAPEPAPIRTRGPRGAGLDSKRPDYIHSAELWADHLRSLDDERAVAIEFNAWSGSFKRHGKYDIRKTQTLTEISRRLPDANAEAVLTSATQGRR